MSGRELTRVEVLSRVKAGTLSLRSAATLLAVSYRQAKRLARRYRVEGAKGLKPSTETCGPIYGTLRRSASTDSNKAAKKGRRGRSSASTFTATV